MARPLKMNGEAGIASGATSSLFSVRLIRLKAHVHPSSFAGLSFCFETVDLLNTVL